MLATIVVLSFLVCLTPQCGDAYRSGRDTPINKWFKYACTAENIKSSNTYYCDSKGKIHCLPGWSDESKLCTVPVCEINGQTCINGNCSAPFTCDCEVGWSGQFCDKCVCLPGCVNGYCNKSFECICKHGWSGMLCDMPVCDGCVNGYCVMPGMCVCDAGWSGPNCTICESREDCAFGRCINEPFECSCYDGYFGSSCENPVCSKGCHPQNGFCMMPDTCWCREGWAGPNCTECVPYWNCQHGHCNNPWECICDLGFSGMDCSENSTVNGNWGQWSNFSSCSVTCGTGIQLRKRHCDNPPKSGNGTYCSIDGSSSVDSHTCTLPPCPTSSNVNGSWGPWGSLSSCSSTCGNGTQTRNRSCSNPPQSGSGAPCNGSAIEVKSCSGNPPCTISNATNVNGTWGSWSSFSACSTTCGNGTQSRNRSCSNPPPSGTGAPCAGPVVEEQSCSGNPPCPINGNYSEWTVFSPCTAICQGDVGNRVRRRFCDSPAPQFGGNNCTALGPDREEIPCIGTIPRQNTTAAADCFTINQ